MTRKIALSDRPRPRPTPRLLVAIAACAPVVTTAARAQTMTGVLTQQTVGSTNLFAPTPLATFQAALTFSNTSVTASGSSTARTMAARAADTVNVADYGAVGDMTLLGYTSYTIAASSTALSATAGVFSSAMVGKTIVLPGAGAAGAGLVAVISGFTDQGHVTLSTAASVALSGVTETPEIGTDNTSAFNNAIAAAEARNSIQASSEYVTGSVYVPDGSYLVKTVNLTNYSNSSLRISGHGVIWGVNAGQPVIDALGSSWLHWTGVGILGDQYAVPSVGIQIGRIGGTSSNSSDNSGFDHFLISGWFSRASLLNEQSETTEFDKVNFYNNYATGIAVAQDGYNHFAATSAYVSNKEPVDTPQSFDENVFTNCIFGAYNPLWIGTTNRMTVTGGYAVSYGPYGVVLYGEPGGDNIQLDLDLHIEDTNNVMTDAFFITGTNSSPFLEGFRWRDHGDVATNSAFKVDSSSSVKTVNMPNAFIDVRNFPFGATKLFDNPAAWGVVTGQVSIPAASYMNLSNFQGLLSTQTSMIDTSVIPAASVQNVLTAEGIKLGGAVSSVSITQGGTYYAVSGSKYTPSITFGAAPAGGTTATGHVSALGLNGEGGLGAAGTGYTVANNVPVEDANGNILFTVNIVSVGSGGAISGLTFNATSTPTIVTTIPASPLQITQNGGSGGTVTGTNFTITGVTVDTAGSGYTTAPSATFSSTGAAPVATGVALLPLQITAPTRLAALSIAAQSGSYTFNANDCGSTVEYTGTTAVTWTVPAGLSSGCQINVVQKSSGPVTITGASGIAAAEYTASGSKTYTTAGQSAEALVLIDSASTFLLSGQVN